MDQLNTSHKPSEVFILKRLLASNLETLLLIMISGTVYLLTILPGVGHSGDTAKFQFVGYVLGTPHATGYPTYILLNFLFTRLVPVGSIAYRANILSGVFTVLALLVFLNTLKALGASRWVSFIGALVLGFSPTLWQQSLFAEVYTLHILFICSVIYLLLRWGESGLDRFFLAACAVYAFSFGNHLTSVLLLPAFGYFVWTTNRRVLWKPKYIAFVLATILLSLTQYLYFFWRTANPNTQYLEMVAPDLKTFIWYVTGAQFRGGLFAYSPMELFSDRIPFYLLSIWQEFGISLLLIPFGVVGLHSIRRNVFLGLFFITQAFFAINYRIPDIEAYFIPNYYVLAIYISAGLFYIAGRVAMQFRRYVSFAFLLIPIILLVVNWDEVNQHDNVAKIRETEAILGTVSADSLIVAPNYNQFEYIMYYLIAEKWGEKGIFSTSDFDPDDLVLYFRGGFRMDLTAQNIQAPPGLEVYLTGVKVRQIRLLEERGFVIESQRGGLLYHVAAP